MRSLDENNYVDYYTIHRMRLEDDPSDTISRDVCVSIVEDVIEAAMFAPLASRLTTNRMPSIQNACIGFSEN